MITAAVARQNPSSFFRTVSAAKNRVLLIDYDGAVGPSARDGRFGDDPPSVPEILYCIMSSCSTRLVVISARGADEVGSQLRIHPAPEIWGTEGLERIHPDGRPEYKERQVSEESLAALAQAEAQLERAGFGEYLEVKLAAVALHWKGIPRQEVPEMRKRAYRVLQPLTRIPDLLLVQSEEGMEIRLASANRASALRRLLSELDDDTPVAYLGNDISEELASDVLNGRGVSVPVKTRSLSDDANMPSPVVPFLMQWITACGGVQ